MEPITINSKVNTKTMGFGAYSALKHNFSFALKVGDIIKLNTKIKGIDSRSHWTTGYYRVTYVGLGLGSHPSNTNDARFYNYWFAKIKKDGTKTNSKFHGWNCHSFDVDILGENLAIRTA